MVGDFSVLCENNFDLDVKNQNNNCTVLTDRQWEVDSSLMVDPE